jgi:hypothetical protein
MAGEPGGRLNDWYGPDVERLVVPPGAVRTDEHGHQIALVDVFEKGINRRGDNREERRARRESMCLMGWSCGLSRALRRALSRRNREGPLATRPLLGRS